MIFSFPSQEMQVCKALSTMAASTQEMLSGPNIVVHTGGTCWALKHPWHWMTSAFLKANMGTLVLLHLLGKLSEPRASARPRRMVMLPSLLHPSACTHVLGTGPPGTEQTRSVVGKERQAGGQSPQQIAKQPHTSCVVLGQRLPLWH